MVLYIVKDGVENCILFIWLLEGFFPSVKYFGELPAFGRLMSEKWDTITQNARFCYGFFCVVFAMAKKCIDGETKNRMVRG